MNIGNPEIHQNPNPKCKSSFSPNKFAINQGFILQFWAKPVLGKRSKHKDLPEGDVSNRFIGGISNIEWFKSPTMITMFCGFGRVSNFNIRPGLPRPGKR
jgi:hypothetical protein